MAEWIALSVRIGQAIATFYDVWRTCRHQPRSEQRTSLYTASVAAAAASYSLALFELSS